MKIAHLSDRSLIEIAGEEAEHFLDNILTCKIIGLEENEAAFGALLSPQGKILFDFFIIKQKSGYLFDIDETLSADFIKRLTFYRLRAKVSIEAKSNLSVYAIWGNLNSYSKTTIQDPRLEAMGNRIYAATMPDAEIADYTQHRISNGIPQGGSDFTYGDAYPHEVLMDQFGGVDFKKGCYVGQEVVSRMQHRGTAKKRIIKVIAKHALPKTGANITADGKPAGTLGSVEGNEGLALLRLDRIANASVILADEVEITTTLQDWINFSMPEVT